MNNTTVLQAPVATVPRRRIAALDVARGVAILGTLWTNIWLFTHPYGLAGYLRNPVPDGASSAEATAESMLMALSQGKFLAVLTLMFGMGLAIQHSSAVRRGIRWPGRYLWRAALLFVDGVVNYILIAEFDVLMGYAVTAAVVSWMLLASPRAQRRLMIGFAVAHVTLLGLVTTAVALTQSSYRPGHWRGPNPYADGSFTDLVAFRLDNLVMFRFEPVLIGFGCVAMFLLGARLLRAGVFTADGAALRRRLMLIGAAAFPLDLALGTFGGAAGVIAERYLVAPLVGLGLLGLIAHVALRFGTDGWIGRRLTEVGRTALTCYLLQNLISGAVFYGWGLGLAAELGDHRVPFTIIAYAGISALVLGFAHLWLRRFRLGPVEWLWKTAGNIGTRA